MDNDPNSQVVPVEPAPSTARVGEFGFDLKYQRFPKFIPVDRKRPEITVEHYTTKAEAEARKADLLQLAEPGEIAACIVSAPSRAKTRKRLIVDPPLTL